MYQKLLSNGFVCMMFAAVLTVVTINPVFAETPSPVNKNNAAKKESSVSENQNILVMNLEYGQVFIDLRPDLAPKHVERIRKLASSGFYDGVIFHRVIDGFMAQTGDPTGTGRGGSGQNIAAEFSKAPFVRGTVGMARAQHPDSADSQFFIVFDDSHFLDGQYTVIGTVVRGMEFVDKIKRGEPPMHPDKILWMQVMSSDAAQVETDIAPPDFIEGQIDPNTQRKSK